jgi:hypothetical protein
VSGFVAIAVDEELVSGPVRGYFDLIAGYALELALFRHADLFYREERTLVAVSEVETVQLDKSAFA